MSRRILVFALMLAVAVSVLSGTEASARPWFTKEFKEVYPDLVTEADKVKCNVCHYSESKKNRNDYGAALGKALDAKSVKDAKKIAEALKKIEDEKSATEGKTFGDLIREKMLPGKAPE